MAKREQLSRLQPRQLEVIALIAQGLSREEIAAQLGIAPQSVKNHIFNAKLRLRPHPTTERLVALYVDQYGLPK